MAQTDASRTLAETTNAVAVKVVGSLNWDIINQVNIHGQGGIHLPFEGNEDLRRPGGHGLNQAVAVYRASHDEQHDAIPFPQNHSETLNFGLTNHVEHDTAVNAVRSKISAHLFTVDVHLIGIVGQGDEDNRGKMIKAELPNLGIKDEGVDTATNIKTGYAHINIDQQGVPMIWTRSFANKVLSWDWVEKRLEEKPRATLILVQLEIPHEIVRKTIKYAKKHNIHIIFNAAPPPDPRENISEDSDFFDVDHLILNSHCAENIRRPDEPDRPHVLQDLSRLELQERYLPMCNDFHRLGARCVVITLGFRGVIASYLEPEDANGGRSQRTFFLDAKREINSEVVDETGASDAFIGAYAVEILRQIVGSEKTKTLNIEAALDMGTKAGGLALAVKGSLDAVPWRSRLAGPTSWLSVNPFPLQ